MQKITGYTEITIVLFLFILIFSGCRTTSGGTDIKIDTEEAPANGAAVLEEAKVLIESGMLGSLVKARALISEENLAGTEQGQELDYIAYSLITLIYPYYTDTSAEATPLKSSIYPSLVEKVRRGVIPEITEANTSFFTLMFAAAAVFYSSDQDVLDRCFEIASQIASFDEKNLYSKLVEAEVYEKKKDFQKSIDLYTAVADADPGCYPASLGIASVRTAMEDYRSALEILEKLYAEYPGGKKIVQLLVDCYIYTKNYADANRVLEEALSRNPDDIDFALKRAWLLILSGRLERAGNLISVFESEKGVTGESLYLRALILVREKRYYKAEEIIREGFSKYGDYLPLAVLYGRLLVDTGRYDKGISFIKSELDIHPGNRDLLNLLMISYVHTGQWEKAGEIVEVLLKNGNDTDTGLLRYGVEIYFRLKRYDAAADLNRKILSSKDASIGDYVYRIKLLLVEGRKKEASAEIDKWLSVSDNAADRSTLWYYKSLSTDDTALKKEYLQKALFENLQNLSAIVALADLYEKGFEYRKAYRYLKQAAIIAPDDMTIRRRLRNLERKIQ